MTNQQDKSADDAPQDLLTLLLLPFLAVVVLAVCCAPPTKNEPSLPSDKQPSLR